MHFATYTPEDAFSIKLNESDLRTFVPLCPGCVSLVGLSGGDGSLTVSSNPRRLSVVHIYSIYSLISIMSHDHLGRVVPIGCLVTSSLMDGNAQESHVDIVS
eukprot:711697-Prorocentrum_minimum.AAC.3